jgi:TPP-dependent pyruvate/acetoin dehydrogenase alpha subunit
MDQIEQEVVQELTDAIEFAHNSPEPSADALEDDVYA